MQLTQSRLAPGWTIRALVPADRGQLVDGFHRLSPETRRRRYLGLRGDLTGDELDLLTGLRPGAEAALAAVDACGGLMAVARAAPEPGDPDTIHVGIVVGDAWQGHGIGSALLAALADRARARGVHHLRASTLADNGPVRHMLARAGAHDWHWLGAGVVEATVDLAPEAVSAQAA